MDLLSTLPDDLIERIAFTAKEDPTAKYHRARAVAVWALAQTNKKIRTAFPPRTLRWACMALQTRVDPFDKQSFDAQLAAERESKELIALANKSLEYGAFLGVAKPKVARAYRKDFAEEVPQYGIAQIRKGGETGDFPIPVISIDNESDFFYVGIGDTVRAYQVGTPAPLARLHASEEELVPGGATEGRLRIPDNEILSLSSRGRWLLVRYHRAVQKYELCTNTSGESELVCRWTGRPPLASDGMGIPRDTPFLCHAYLDASAGEPGAHGVVTHRMRPEEDAYPSLFWTGYGHWDIEKQREYESRDRSVTAIMVYTWYSGFVRFSTENSDAANNGKEIAIGYGDRKAIRIHDAKTFRLIQTVWCPHRLKIGRISLGYKNYQHKIALSPNGQFLAYSAQTNDTRKERKVLVYTRNANGLFNDEKDEIFEWRSDGKDYDDNMRSLKFTACSRFLVVTTYCGGMMYFDFSPRGFLPRERRSTSPYRKEKPRPAMPDLREVRITEGPLGELCPRDFFPYKMIWQRSSLLMLCRDGSILSMYDKAKHRSEGSATAATSA